MRRQDRTEVDTTWFDTVVGRFIGIFLAICAWFSVVQLVFQDPFDVVYVAKMTAVALFTAAICAASLMRKQRNRDTVDAQAP